MTAAAGTSHLAVPSLAGWLRTRSGGSRGSYRRLPWPPKLGQRVAAVAANELVLPNSGRPTQFPA